MSWTLTLAILAGMLALAVLDLWRRLIAERARTEEAREAANERIQAKDDELERFIYTVSHDLKAPLITLHGFLGLLEKDLAAGRTQRVERDVDRILSAATDLERLLKDLLELSRIGRFVTPPEMIPLTAAAREAAEHSAGRIAERGIALEIAPDMPALAADRLRIVQALRHLIDNAVKFIGEGEDPRIEIGAREDGGEIVCHVRDNGIGIAPRYHQQIFGLFERLDKDHEGTGVGLALVQRIMELHGGRVWVESRGEGHGSTFTFALPRQPAST